MTVEDICGWTPPKMLDLWGGLAYLLSCNEKRRSHYHVEDDGKSRKVSQTNSVLSCCPGFLCSGFCPGHQIKSYPKLCSDPPCQHSPVIGNSNEYPTNRGKWGSTNWRGWMAKKYSKRQRLKFNTKSQNHDDFRSGYKQSAKWRIKKAKQMIDYENEAKRRGVPVSRVIAEAIQ